VRLDALLARRSRSQVLRLAWVLLAVLVAGPVLISLVPSAERGAGPAAGKAPVLHLPPANECPTPDAAERERLAARLADFGKQIGVKVPAGSSEDDLARALAAIDARLGTPDPHRDPGPLRDRGPLQRQLRTLLWKHAVEGYDAPGINLVEMVEKLERKVTTPRLEGGPP
jgi:hypothetical protein